MLVFSKLIIPVLKAFPCLSPSVIFHSPRRNQPPSSTSSQHQSTHQIFKAALSCFSLFMLLEGKKHPQSSLLAFFKICFRSDSYSQFEGAAPRPWSVSLHCSSGHLQQPHTSVRNLCSPMQNIGKNTTERHHCPSLEKSKEETGGALRAQGKSGRC